MTIDTSRVVKLLAAKFDFDADEGAEFLAAAGVSKTARKTALLTDRTVRTNRTDFLEDLAVAETKDEAKASAKAKAAAKKADREAKKAAKEAKEAKPKRAPTGYLLFCDYLRPEVKAALEKELEEGEKLKPTDTVRELAAQWKDLSDQDRAEWNAKAAQVKESMAAQSASATTSSDSE
jgi:gluconate kinase